jgi:hypothetical protein
VTLSSPSGTTDSSPAFTWNHDAGATWYKLFIWNSAEQKIHATWYKADNICADGVCWVALESGLANDGYEWWVKSWNEAGSVWSDAMEFTVTD